MVISGLTTRKCERNHSVCGFGHLLGLLGYILYSSCLQPLIGKPKSRNGTIMTLGKPESLCEGAFPPFLGLAVLISGLSCFQVTAAFMPLTIEPDFLDHFIKG